MMKPERPVGIVGYGVYIPRFRIAAREIARIWDGAGGTPVDSKSVPGPDEDTIIGKAYDPKLARRLARYLLP